MLIPQSRDLACIVNDISNDPIELRPFDNSFTESKIIKTWIAVDFLPMTGNTANNLKVSYELGEGGAPEEVRVRMESLVDDYSEVAEKLTNSGFNGNILNLAPRQVSRETFPEDEEAQIEHIIKNKGMTKAGKLYKAGIIMANRELFWKRIGDRLYWQRRREMKQYRRRRTRSNNISWRLLMHFIDGWRRDSRSPTTPALAIQFWSGRMQLQLCELCYHGLTS